MAKAKQINIAAITQIAGDPVAGACLVRVEDNDGKEFDLVFAADSARTIVNRILAAAEMALERSEGARTVHGALVTACAVRPSEDASLVQVEMLSGDARLLYGLPPNVSATLREDLEIAERRMATARKSTRN